jgi:hypothetical protein
MPLRVGDDLLASAKLAADATGRSAAQQIGYWAKLGRELERSSSVSVREVADVLAGARSYDELDAKAQAVVRAEWDARIEARRAALNLAERFAAEGRSWVEAGADGAPVHRPAAARATRGAASASRSMPSTTKTMKATKATKATTAQPNKTQASTKGQPGKTTASTPTQKKKAAARTR